MIERHSRAVTVLVIIAIVSIAGILQAAGVVDWRSFGGCPSGEAHYGDRIDYCEPIP